MTQEYAIKGKSFVMNIDRKILIIGFIMTIVNYLVSFFFSSREILLDSKNLCLVFVCSMCWAYLVVREKNKGAVWGIYFSSLALGFFVPMLALFEEPFYMRRLMKDFLFWYSLPLLFIAFSAIKSRYNFLKPVLAVGSVVYFIIAFIPLLIISMYHLIIDYKLQLDDLRTLHGEVALKDCL